MENHLAHHVAPINISADFSFSVGQKFRRGQMTFAITERQTSQCVLQNLETLETRSVDVKSLYEKYLDQSIVPFFEDPHRDALVKLAAGHSPMVPADLVNLSPAVLARGLLIIRYIKALNDLGYQSLRPTPLLELDYKKVQRTIAHDDPSSIKTSIALSTLYTWSVRIKEADGDWRVVFPKFSKRGGPGRARVRNDSLEVLHEVWLSLKKKSTARIRFADISKDVMQRLRSRLSEGDILSAMPSRSTIERLTKKEFGAYVICARNKGKKFADKEFRDWHARDRAGTPLQVVEFDDKDSRVFLIDDRTGLPYGRAHITSGIDQYSSVPLAMSIGDRPRSTLSALDAFKRVLLPKSSNADFAALNEPPEFFGTPAIALFDNALYNHEKNVQRAVHESSSAFCAWAKPYTPTEKSIVEDYNGRMVMGIFELLPGFGGPKTLTDGLTEGLQNATMSLQGFSQCLNKWAYQVYCNTPRAEGITPRQLWHAAMRDGPERVPANLNLLDMIFSLQHEVLLRPNGIEFCRLSYQSEQLVALRRRLGAKKKIVFRYHPNCMSRVYALDPYRKEYFMVPSTSPAYTEGLTLVQHKWIRKLARDRGATNPSIPQLLEAREALRILAAQSRVSRKRIERRWANAIGELANQPQSTATSSEPIEIITELEYQIDQISKIELVQVDENDWNLPEDF